MSEKIYRLNEGGLLLYVREDIPTQWRGSAFVCQRGYTDSMKGGCFCMSEKIYRLNVREHITGSAFVCQRRYTDSMKGVCFCMSEKIYRLNEGGLLLYVREDIPTQ